MSASPNPVATSKRCEDDAASTRRESSPMSPLWTRHLGLSRYCLHRYLPALSLATGAGSSLPTACKQNCIHDAHLYGEHGQAWVTSPRGSGLRKSNEEVSRVRSARWQVSASVTPCNVRTGKRPACSSNAVVLPKNTLRVYGFAVFYQGCADALGVVRYARLVADAGPNDRAFCTPSPARTLLHHH